MNMKKTFRNLGWGVLFAVLLSTGINAQEQAKTDSVKAAAPKAGETTNMMLNASADNGPRVVNIGLPASVGGTVILENGLPVTYDYMGQSPTALWCQDAGIAKFSVLNVSETAILSSDVVVSGEYVYELWDGQVQRIA
jgi:hypothetical protein